MLTDNQRAKITMMMRTTSVLQKNLHVIQDNQQLMNGLTRAKVLMDQIFEELTNEERDQLLEQYKVEAELMGLWKGSPPLP
jgi:hypothetical protein